ncbi:MAG: contact-dependent growth inhibition system immunity protein, partial [Cellvibrionaceae bacterium]
MDREVLTYFFSCYFHQDWFLDYGSYDQAVINFCNSEDQAKVENLVQSINELLLSNEYTEKTPLEYGGYIKVSAFDLSVSEWLNKILEVIDSNESIGSD